MSNIDLNRELQTIKNNNPIHGALLEKWLRSYFYYIKNENTSLESRIPTIKRGQILYVDFGYNVQSEFRYVHYCVALHESTRLNKKVTVVPITSKAHPHQIAIGSELGHQLEIVIRSKERSSFWQPYRALKPELEKRGIPFNIPAISVYDTVHPSCSSLILSLKQMLSSDDPLQVDLDRILKSLDDFQKFIDQAPELLKDSYLKVADITTISKARVIFPKTKTHPLMFLKLSDETLNRLDDEILRRFTKKH